MRAYTASASIYQLNFTFLENRVPRSTRFFCLRTARTDLSQKVRQERGYGEEAR